MAVVKKYCDYW